MTATATDDRANELKAHVLALLHEEALKAFASGPVGPASDFVDAYRRRVENVSL